MPDTLTLIQKITLGSSTTNVTFTNIPQTYTDLKIVISARSDRSGAVNSYIRVLPNSNSTGINVRTLYGTGTSVISFTESTAPHFIAEFPASPSTASVFSNLDVYIPNYVSSSNKSFSSDGVMENNASQSYLTLTASTWANSSAITSIQLQDALANFVANSTFYLYGISNSATTTPNTAAAYATGGDIITTDGTYWIHTFRSSGTFTPKKALSNVDYLVVAGGGGGGRANNGGYSAGGGGGGGLRCTVSATGGGGSLESKLALSANTNYTVTIGAGGSGGGADNTGGFAGSNSVFSTITSTGGGAGGGQSIAPISGGTGGSGGGGGGTNPGTGGGAGTANQGYAGGGGSNGYNGGGGGGAGAAGANGANSGVVGGAGGNGVATSISGSSVTYAGGGGGAGYNTVSTAGTGGGGAGSASMSIAGVAGTANTGGGGGGSSPSATNNGGSGIVIVRYPV